MSDLRAAAQQGLDAIYRWHMTDGETADLMPAFEALRAALAQPAASGEPVAWIESPHGAIRANRLWKLDPMPPQSVAWSIPLYTAPSA